MRYVTLLALLSLFACSNDVDYDRDVQAMCGPRPATYDAQWTTCARTFVCRYMEPKAKTKAELERCVNTPEGIEGQSQQGAR